MTKILRNRYGELRAGWTMPLAFVILMGTAGPLVRFFRWLFGDTPLFTVEWPNYMLLYRSIECLCAVGGSVVLFWLLYRRGPAEMGYVRNRWASRLGIGLLWGAGSILAVFLLLLLAGQLRVEAVNLSVLATFDFWSWFIAFAMGAAAEEAIYRCMLMSCAKTTRNLFCVFLFPSLFFSYAHVGNNNVTPLALFNIVLAGVWLSVIFWRTGSFWVAYGSHFAWNFCQGCVLGMNVSGFETSSLITSRFVGAPIFTGGEFGAEGGLGCTIAMILSTLLAFVAFRRPEKGGWTMEGGLPLVDRPAPPLAAGADAAAPAAPPAQSGEDDLQETTLEEK